MSDSFVTTAGAVGLAMSLSGLAAAVVLAIAGRRGEVSRSFASIRLFAATSTGLGGVSSVVAAGDAIEWSMLATLAILLLAISAAGMSVMFAVSKAFDSAASDSLHDRPCGASADNASEG